MMSLKEALASSTTLPRFFRETAISSVDPERLRYVCDQCGEVQEPIAFSGYYVRRRCYCTARATLWLPYDGGASNRVQAQAYRDAESARRCYTWLAPHDDRDLAVQSFDDFDPARQPAARRAVFVEALASARHIARQVILSRTVQSVAIDNLILRGNYGVGKTHLAAAICNTLIAAHIPCRFCAVPDLFAALYAASFEDKRALIEEAAATPLLVLDDLDKLHTRAETEGAYQKTMLFDLLNARYRGHVPTVITTNAGALSQWFDGATISRLSERLTKLDLIGTDLRLA